MNKPEKQKYYVVVRLEIMARSFAEAAEIASETQIKKYRVTNENYTQTVEINIVEGTMTDITGGKSILNFGSES